MFSDSPNYLLKARTLFLKVARRSQKDANDGVGLVGFAIHCHDRLGGCQGR